MDVGFCIDEAGTRGGPLESQPPEPEKTNPVTTENIDPEIGLRPICALVLESEADERGQLITVAFTKNGLPMVVVLNTN